MVPKIICSIILFFASCTLTAQVKVELVDLASHVGDSVTVTGKVHSVKYLQTAKGKPTFLNIGGGYPNAPLTVVIWEDSRKKFSTPPDHTLKGQTITIHGRVEKYQGRLQIVVREEEQLLAGDNINIRPHQ